MLVGTGKGSVGTEYRSAHPYTMLQAEAATVQWHQRQKCVAETQHEGAVGEGEVEELRVTCPSPRPATAYRILPGAYQNAVRGEGGAGRVRREVTMCWGGVAAKLVQVHATVHAIQHLATRKTPISCTTTTKPEGVYMPARGMEECGFVVT